MPGTHALNTSGACGALRLVGGRHNNVGVSLQERRDTTQVMLGVSLRARWDATLVFIMVLGHTIQIYLLLISVSGVATVDFPSSFG